MRPTLKLDLRNATAGCAPESWPAVLPRAPASRLRRLPVPAWPWGGGGGAVVLASVLGRSIRGLPYTTLPTLYPSATGPCGGRDTVCRVRLRARDRVGAFGGYEMGPGWWRCVRGGRESIFLFSHTNEFCGKSKVALERPVAWPPHRWGR